ncbi:unnamed protein product [Fraxinus pennsylvanica]|uniref:GHMP kinase N-terminal domain-containing protein n=1 Tax=Fraxinus pennsylvanica TaxID=56036 RepID=A0AAD1ZR06_9LAMI|nr:unnamed protein product [Fraxinus pennsylvanica]
MPNEEDEELPRLFDGLAKFALENKAEKNMIHLDKKVPTGAGLVRGSSNAATTLWAANQFSGCVANEKELQQWTDQIGSDVPFFFSHCMAIVQVEVRVQNQIAFVFNVEVVVDTALPFTSRSNVPA